MLQISELKFNYKQNDGKEIRALRGIDFSLTNGESAALVGESGCGKTTLCNIVNLMLKDYDGSVLFDGKELKNIDKTKDYYSKVQYIFQDPKGAMNPYFTLRRVLIEPLRINFPKAGKAELVRRAEEMAGKVGLPAGILDAHPYEVSGGEAQRIAIARALLLEPEVIIADECVSALDLSIQAEVVNLLRHARNETCASFLFISHDLDLVRYFCDRVYVMLHGRIVECLDCRHMEEDAASEYTRMLLEDAYGKR